MRPDAASRARGFGAEIRGLRADGRPRPSSRSIRSAIPRGASAGCACIRQPDRTSRRHEAAETVDLGRTSCAVHAGAAQETRAPPDGWPETANRALTVRASFRSGTRRRLQLRRNGSLGAVEGGARHLAEERSGGRRAGPRRGDAIGCSHTDKAERRECEQSARPPASRT